MTEKIRDFVQTALTDRSDLFLVDVIKKGNDRSSKLVVILDGDQGVTIDDCSSISRQLSQYLDEAVDSDNPYTLEVTSSGLDHPLLLKRQYHKNINKNIKVIKNDDTELEGELVEVHDEEIIIESLLGKKKAQKEKNKIEFKDIKKTFVLVSFK